MDTSPYHATTMRSRGRNLKASGDRVTSPPTGMVATPTRNLNLIGKLYVQEVICLFSGQGVLFIFLALLIN